MSNEYYSQYPSIHDRAPSPPPPPHHPLQPGAASVEVRRSEFDPVFVGDIWAKRIVLGLVGLFVLWSLATVVLHDSHDSAGCVQLEHDRSFSCRWGFGCQPPTSKPCPKKEDVAALVQLGADITRTNFELGRADLLSWALVLTLTLTINLRGVSWAAEVFCRVRLTNDLWMALLWTGIAVTPYLYSSAHTPMYTDVSSFSQAVRSTSSYLNPFSWGVRVFLFLWPIVATVIHFRISVCGTQGAAAEARFRMDWAADMTQRSLATASNTVSALRTTANTIRDTANTTYEAVASTSFTPLRQSVAVQHGATDYAALPPLPPLSPLPKPRVSWGANTRIYAGPPSSSSRPVASAPTPPMHSSPSRSSWDDDRTQQPMMYSREGQLVYGGH